ncbi:fibronectin type III domain-containing protein [Marivirga arenosa]|uniref:Fibronectin type III domain-containing protein n=1 Tax=Marivirga arenosa TaxID=3059076 RepID=A0AA51RC58_9BACT|nr:fibronectin type III domain-containing protein [Marivirga sp. ABR2-2]WMN06019.1 fibronectin type III domain-containing protein [Marivirga sp. ABR2-2]
MLSFFGATQTQAQVSANPVQVTSNLVPPYSLYLSDYSDASLNKWNIQLLLRDFTQTDYQAKLRITIEGAGIRLRTRQGFSTGGIRLEPGIPYQVDATLLSQYLNLNNMEVSGINRAQLASTQKLPEGFYQFRIEVLDFQRGNRVSNVGTSMAWIVLNDPPLLNLPFEDKLRLQDPQQIQFQWTPRHTASPNSAFETEYKLRIWEIWPEGRNPNEVARTTQPLVEKTVMNTSYFYGLNDVMLIPGRSYAWQVQAVNLTGRDLFKNQGKSEVKAFQYGDACLPITNLGAEALGTDRIKMSWEGEWNHMRYIAQIREKGTEDWFNYGTNLETQVIYDLNANTEYEMRVLPSCGAIEGAIENTISLRTLEAEEVDFECGADPNLPTIENQEVIAQLQIGDRITAAGFEVVITELNQMGDTYTGLGLIEVPLFNSARIEANLLNIKVNTDKQLIAGDIESIYNPNAFIIDLDQDEPGLDESGEGDSGNEDEEDSFDDLPEPDIEIEGDIEEVIVDEDTGTITVIDEEGNETEIDPETADENEDGDIVIEDGSGNTYIVDDEGNVSGPHSPDSGGGSKNSPEETIAQEELISVHFEPDDQMQYGLDLPRPNYGYAQYQVQEVLENSYSIGWKALAAGRMDRVSSTWDGAEENGENIGYRSNTLMVTKTDAAETARHSLSITGGAHQMEDRIEAFMLVESEDEEEQEVVTGILNTVSYNELVEKVVVIPVNGADISKLSNLQMELNNIYAQAVTRWEVSMHSGVQYDFGDTFDNGVSGMLSNYTSHMRRVKRAFGNENTIDNKTYYLFVVPGQTEESSKQAFMPRKRQSGFLFAENMKNLSAEQWVNVLAHELGHGAFRLEHHANASGSTDNLMDYSEGSFLHKAQWDLIQDPEAMVALFQDDADGAYDCSNCPEYELENADELVFAPNSIPLEIDLKIEEAYKNQDVEFTIEVINNAISREVKIWDMRVINSTDGIITIMWDGSFNDGSEIHQNDLPVKLRIKSKSSSGGYFTTLVDIPLSEYKYPWYDREPQQYIDPRHSNYLSYEDGTFDYEKFKNDTGILIDFRSAKATGTESQIASEIEKFKQFYLMHWSEYMYSKGIEEVSELSSSQKEQLRSDFRNYWKNHTFEHGEASLVYYAIRDDLWQAAHEEFLRKLDAKIALKEAIENRKSAVIKEAFISGSSIVISVLLFPGSGGSSAWITVSRFAAGASIFVTASSIKGNYDEYIALDNKIYDPNRVYDPIEGYLVSTVGSEGVVIYDLLSIYLDIRGGSYENAQKIYNRLAQIGTVNESQIRTFLRAIALGNSSVTIKNTIIDLIP